MSLDPEWYSTIFGLLTIVGWGLTTFAFTIIVLSMLERSGAGDRHPASRGTSTTSAS